MDIRQVGFTEGLQVGYHWYKAQDIDPLFEFGHGLSYTEFDFSKVSVTPQFTSGDEEIRVQCRPTNTGERVGSEVAQVYVELPAVAGEPSQRLIGWEHVTLQPGEHRNVEIALSSEDLADLLLLLLLLQYWHESTESWTTAPGTYTVHVGGSVDTEQEATFRIK